MTKEEIKKAIKDLEWLSISTGGKLCGLDIKVVNLRVLKETAKADIIINDNNSAITRYNNCIYWLKDLI